MFLGLTDFFKNQLIKTNQSSINGILNENEFCQDPRYYRYTNIFSLRDPAR
jgi:hypothetical protein